MWPEIVHLSEIQGRLLGDGVPAERAMFLTTQLAQMQPGQSRRVERPQGDIYLYRTDAPSYFAVTAAE
jgi:hypothetical protein